MAAATAALRRPWCRVYGHRFKNGTMELFVLPPPLLPMALCTALCTADLLVLLPIYVDLAARLCVGLWEQVFVARTKYCMKVSF